MWLVSEAARTVLSSVVSGTVSASLFGLPVLLDRKSRETKGVLGMSFETALMVEESLAARPIGPGFAQTSSWDSWSKEVIVKGPHKCTVEKQGALHPQDGVHGRATEHDLPYSGSSALEDTRSG